MTVMNSGDRQIRLLSMPCEESLARNARTGSALKTKRKAIPMGSTAESNTRSASYAIKGYRASQPLSPEQARNKPVQFARGHASLFPQQQGNAPVLYTSARRSRVFHTLLLRCTIDLTPLRKENLRRPRAAFVRDRIIVACT